MEEKIVKTDDGTSIAYQLTGNRKGFPIVLANGLGGTIVTYKKIIDAHKERFRFVSWDYRGLFHSSAPPDLSKLSVRDHVGDCKRVLEEEGIEGALFMGWSMGVQVVLDYYDTFPDMVEGLITMNGTFGRPFDTAFNFRGSRVLIPAAIRLGQKGSPAISPILRRVVASPHTFRLLKRVGMLSPCADEAVFREVAREYGSMDLWFYCEIYKHLADHNAEEVLVRIDVPTLIFAGQKDFFTPSEVSAKMAATIKGAELCTIPAASHYAAIEFSELINLRIEKFVRERLPMIR